MPPYIAFLLGALIGALGSAFVPPFQRFGRPLLKEAIKAGMVFARDAQVQVVEWLETVEDLYAEAKAETDALATPAAAAPARPAARKRGPAGARKTPAAEAVPPAAKRTGKRAVKSPAQDTEAA